jgi:hypothetical protein
MDLDEVIESAEEAAKAVTVLPPDSRPMIERLLKKARSLDMASATLDQQARLEAVVERLEQALK